MNSNLPHRWATPREICSALVWCLVFGLLLLVRITGLLLTLLPLLIISIVGVSVYRFLPDSVDTTELDIIVTIGAIICFSLGGYIATKAIDKITKFFPNLWNDVKEWGNIKCLLKETKNICATILGRSKRRDFFSPWSTSSRSPRQEDRSPRQEGQKDKCEKHGRFRKAFCRIGESAIVILLLMLLCAVVTVQQYSSKQEASMHNSIAQSVDVIRNNLHWHWYFSPDTTDSAGEFDDTTIVPVLHVLHPDDAKMPSMNGICMGHGALEWLDLFKKAMEQCAGSGTKIELEIGGYASIAPVAVNESLAHSNTLNLAIANLRSESVAMLLSHPGTLDKLIHDATTADVCARDEKYVETNVECARLVDDNLYRYRCDGSDDSSSMDIRYRQWRSYADMTGRKPSDDGSPDDRRYDVEFLNRTTEIKVIKACPGPRRIQRQRP